ncbi:MAG: DUF6495 family protein [Crocinitomicaceae bacterium]|nr:DUF6495 family protein [Crocinitomicaceae bacterium]
MKYRLLTDDELSSLEDELKAFLIVNGVDGTEWEKINKQSPEKAVRLVELFSDSVLEKVYSKIQFLEFRSPKMCLVFKINEDNSDLISLQVKENSIADLSTIESIHNALIQHARDILMFTQNKKHTKSRGEEVHLLLEQGCVPSVEEFWLSLNKVMAE